MWYVIQVRAGREDYVTDRCRQMIASGEEVFVPKTIFLRRFHGSDEKLTVPMFPGYVFFDTDNIDIFFYKLKKIYGFTKILRTDGEFTPLSPSEEAMIRALGGDDHLVEMSTGYKKGSKVTITEGPLFGLEGSIVRIDRSKRTAVLNVEFLGEERQIKIGLRVLSEADIEVENSDKDVSEFCIA